MFPGSMLKAHLEIDHMEGSATVLDKDAMLVLIEKIGQKYNYEVSACQNSRGGNRAHVFIDHDLALDDSPSKTRVIRAPFARSPKAFRRDQYTPWAIYTLETNTVRDAEDMGLRLATGSARRPCVSNRISYCL
ncbi:hypothetical protein T492DRAFT_848590 [Pavlovales sp. CCMP2436]|nr:hypothetical protein T492DRAFT_848590 [Pavlovales sp. CCMP2436]